jgi:uncharacterized protein (DUF1697 family)
MPPHIALLRGVNLAGRRALKMAALRQCLTEVGCADVQTLLQSGNVVFRAGRRAGSALEGWLEDAVASQLGLRTDICVRSVTEWKALIAANPFPDEAKRDPAHLIAVCLKTSPAPGAVDALRSAITGPERVEGVGRELYVVYPAGIGQSRLTAALIDSRVGVRGTARNWNTVQKLGALVSGGGRPRK